MLNAKDMQAVIERTLDEVLPGPEVRPVLLSEAMRYAVGSGGKRIRPMICLASSVAVGGSIEDARYSAAAIELLHNYTLVHDDLPAMDNDRERRGQSSTWVKFGEANAILVGDALQALAFEEAAKVPRNAAQVVATLGEMGLGVVRGQVEDIAKSADRDYVYAHKTADLFVAAAVMGGLAGGGGEAEIAALREFAFNLGMAFQYEDDRLDGDTACSRKELEILIEESTRRAVSALETLSGDVDFLRQLAMGLKERSI